MEEEDEGEGHSLSYLLLDLAIELFVFVLPDLGHHDQVLDESFKSV